MEERQEIRKLAKALKARNVNEQTGVIISLQVRKDGKRDRLMRWMEENPDATADEIEDKALAMYLEKQK